MIKPKVLLTTIPSDSHNWNLIYMQMLMEEYDFEVINLGVCCPYEEVEKACFKFSPPLVVVSTVNGHGYIEGKELITRLRAIPHMNDAGIYIGGKLSTDIDSSCFHAVELEVAGYTKAYYENIDPVDFMSELKIELIRQRNKNRISKSLNA